MRPINSHLTNNHDPDEEVNATKAAKLLGVSTRTLKRWRDQEIGPCFIKESPQVIRYRVNDLIEFADSQERSEGLPEEKSTHNKKPVPKDQRSTPPKVTLFVSGEKHELHLKEGAAEKLVEATGTEDFDLQTTLCIQVASALPEYDRSEQNMNAALAMLHGIRPQDELEGMLATQMVAVHNLSLSCAKRALQRVQAHEESNYHINRMTKLMHTFMQQMKALQRYRGKGQQTMTVQHVNVNQGGQAVVGNIGGSTGNGKKQE